MKNKGNHGGSVLSDTPCPKYFSAYKYGRTNWFETETPAAEGVYETTLSKVSGPPKRDEDDLVVSFQYWNAPPENGTAPGFWGMCTLSPDEAVLYKAYRSSYANPRWRGLRRPALR